MFKLSSIFPFLLLAPLTCVADLQTGSDVGYGDGQISSGKLSLVSENAYFGGMLGNWQSVRASNESVITGFLVGYKTRGNVFLDMALGGYDELAASRLNFNSTWICACAAAARKRNRASWRGNFIGRLK